MLAMRLPPHEFTRDLTAYDRELRARWAHRIGLWFIEKKMPERLLRLLAGRPNPWKSPRGLDLYDGWKDGYDHVMTVHPDLLQWSYIEPRLAAADKYRRDRLQDANRRLDEIQEAEEKAADRKIANWLENATDDAFEDLQWKLGNRIAMTEPDRPGFHGEHVEQHEGFVVRDRRVMAGISERP